MNMEIVVGKSYHQPGLKTYRKVVAYQEGGDVAWTGLFNKSETEFYDYETIPLCRLTRV
jgi:hypothetical protein